MQTEGSVVRIYLEDNGLAEAAANMAELDQEAADYAYFPVKQALGHKNIASTAIYPVPTDEQTGKAVSAALAGFVFFVYFVSQRARRGAYFPLFVRAGKRIKVPILLRFVGNPAHKLFPFDGRKTSTPVQV